MTTSPEPGAVLELFSGYARDMLNEPTAYGARKVAELRRADSGAWLGPVVADGHRPSYFGRILENGAAVAVFGVDIGSPGLAVGQTAEVKLNVRVSDS